VDSYAVSRWLISCADLLGNEALSSIPNQRVRLLSAMSHEAGCLLETCASTTITSRMLSRGAFWRTRRYGIVLIRLSLQVDMIEAIVYEALL